MVLQDVQPSQPDVLDEGYYVQQPDGTPFLVTPEIEAGLDVDDAALHAALDAIPETSYREAIEALKAAPPTPERMSRQAARRLAIQLCWQRLSQPGPDGRLMPRHQRRRLMFGPRGERMFRFSDLARSLQGVLS